MSARFHLGPKPRLGYTESLVERAAEKRADPAALAALRDRPDARAYLLSLINI